MSDIISNFTLYEASRAPMYTIWCRAIGTVIPRPCGSCRFSLLKLAKSATGAKCWGMLSECLVVLLCFEWFDFLSYMCMSLCLVCIQRDARSFREWMWVFDLSYVCITNSGLRNENPANSVWSKFIMNNLSVGVRSVFSEVNCLSKFDTSLRCLIFGLKGGWTSRAATFSQSIRRKKGCDFTSSSPLFAFVPNLLAGFLVRSPLQISLLSFDMDFGYETEWSVIAWNNSSSSSPSNGGWPTSISFHSSRSRSSELASDRLMKTGLTV